MKNLISILILVLFISLSSFSQEYQNIWQIEIKEFDDLNGSNPLQEGILFTGVTKLCPSLNRWGGSIGNEKSKHND